MTQTGRKNLTRKEQGEETRTVLMETGARLFATQGLHGVSLRTLVREAGVNLSTVSYHFGGKVGLYEAIIRFFITRRDEICPSAAAVCRRFEESDDTPQAKGNIVSWYITLVVQGLLGREEHIWPCFIISREVAQPTDIFPILEAEFFTPSYTSFNALVTGVLAGEGIKIDSEERIIIVQALLGMCLKFLEGHLLITKRLGWKNYDQRGIAKIAEVLSKRTRGFLGLPME
jgi:AcrR family transcriptional regulator